MRWRQNPQRVAWTILVANLVACCVLAVSAPLAARAFVMHSTVPLTAYVATTAGTVQLHVPGSVEPSAVPERHEAPEGAQVVTDQLAQALLTIAENDGDRATVLTVRILQSTALTISQVRTPRFGWSGDPNTIELKLERGRVRVARPGNSTRSLRIRLETPHASIGFDGTAFDVAVRGEETQITTLDGTASVIAAGTEVTAASAQRVIVSAGRAPNLPVPAEQNLIRNGGFDEGLAPAWQELIDVPDGHEPGQVLRDTTNQMAVRFLRRAEDGTPNSAGVWQALDQDVQGDDSLVLRFDLLCLHQSVPGGGQLSSEYPVKVDIAYTDVYGKSLHWFEGFYCLDLPPGSPWPLPTGQRVSLGVWYTYESPNLMELLRETCPARIESVTISANGHDYESLITDVALIAR